MVQKSQVGFHCRLPREWHCRRCSPARAVWGSETTPLAGPAPVQAALPQQSLQLPRLEPAPDLPARLLQWRLVLAMNLVPRSRRVAIAVSRRLQTRRREPQIQPPCPNGPAAQITDLAAMPRAPRRAPALKTLFAGPYILLWTRGLLMARIAVAQHQALSDAGEPI